MSSLIAQGTEFPLKKPAGFHWDIFLLGLTTGVAGILGIPAPNGLIPQAPFHTNSLCVTRQVPDPNETLAAKGHSIRIVDHIVEQRFSNLAQGLLFVVTMTPPLLVVLHLIPQAVLAGLFFVMGLQALEANGITQKIQHLLSDKNLTVNSSPLSRIPLRKLYAFVGLELLGFGATFAITQTIAAIGFPIFILILIPARAFLLPRYFTSDELAILDAPTASPFTMESAGGSYHHDNPDGIPRNETVLPVAVESATDNDRNGLNSSDSGDAIEMAPLESVSVNRLWKDQKRRASGVEPAEVGLGRGTSTSRSRRSRSRGDGN